VVYIHAWLWFIEAWGVVILNEVNGNFDSGVQWRVVAT